MYQAAAKLQTENSEKLQNQKCTKSRCSEPPAAGKTDDRHAHCYPIYADPHGQPLLGGIRLTLTREAGWYKDAIIYQIHVRAFFDSNGDGIGDFQGLAQKLDYVQELGVNAIWLMPFFPSPLRDDGYDISDYRSVHPSYGTLEDFKTFLSIAHDRGIRVIIELVGEPHLRSASLVPGIPEFSRQSET